MSETEPVSAGASKVLKPPIAEAVIDGRDVTLSTLLVGLGRDDDRTVGMTLTFAVGGLLISGLAIPYGSWRSELDDSLRATGDGGGVIAAAMDGLWQASDEQRAGFAEDSSVLRDYVYLRNANYWAGPRVVEMPLARVKLASIDAWSMGAAQIG